MSYAEDQERVRQLALLCFESRDFTDEELDQIIVSSAEIGRYFNGLERFAEFGASQVKRYRRRRAELEKVPTKELQRMSDEMSRERGRILKDDVNDELDDSFFEAPPIDSAEHIIRELLKEKQEKAPAT